MKNLWMTKLAMAFETPAEGGGGAAVAAPPAAAAAPAAEPAAAAPASVTPEPAKSGFFKGLKKAAFVPPGPETISSPSDVPPDTKVQVKSDDGSQVLFEGTAAEADAFVKKSLTAPAPVAPAPAAPAPTAGALPRAFAGHANVTTFEAAEDLYRKSQTEALRLNDRAKALETNLQKATVDSEARVAALTAELELARKTPAVVEKTEAELEALAKENPFQFHKYMEAKQARTQAIQAAKERADKGVRERAERIQNGAKQAMATFDAMKKDAKAYPKFNELIPRIDAIYDGLPADRKSQLDSDPEGPKTLYKMAMGEIYIELQGKGIDAQADAAEQARRKAASDAAAAGAGGAPGTSKGPDTRTAQQKKDDEWREWRAKARGSETGSRVFRERK
jgi:hypothetical protein